MAQNESVSFGVQCIKTKKPFFARYDFAYDGVWVLSYGLTEKPADTVSGDSGTVTVDVSKSRTGPQYRCPHCGSRYFVRCGMCGALTCWNGSDAYACGSCGRTGKVSGYIDAMEGKRDHAQ